ncbi:PepSY domain-containing protein [Parvularcula lutaonensis]|uniref:PepSY domain-containing protein n=1 Tax=Parvularcula lutaonensis TaxID=491923 RepID=A0ABV7MF14_9PROT|nr:PepSY domain-containing protein [Parvularcula lutaonensis]GGY48867.1 hypothetical protein GCM10007148_16710 [Parvularcula lutaonensis]
MPILKWTVRIHKWVALVIGVQVMLWILDGFVMSVLPIERVRGEHRVAEVQLPVLMPEGMLSLQQAAEAAGMPDLVAAETGLVQGETVWRLTDLDGNRATVRAQDGEVLSPADETLARMVAEADYTGPGALTRIELIEELPTEVGGEPPVWRAVFDDRDNTTLYIDPDTVEVRSRRSTTWRVFDFFWKLHVMDYDDGEDFNHPLLVTAAGAGLIVAFSGLTLLFLRMRRLIIAKRNARRA